MLYYLTREIKYVALNIYHITVDNNKYCILKTHRTIVNIKYNIKRYKLNNLVIYVIYAVL